jgi:hypothetical protein
LYPSSSRFDETPGRKRRIVSPSAWKSPLFINTALPGPRFDMDLTFEVVQIPLVDNIVESQEKLVPPSLFSEFWEHGIISKNLKFPIVLTIVEV